MILRMRVKVLLMTILLLLSSHAASSELQSAVDAIDTGAYKQAHEQLLALSNKGDRDAQTLLGLLYSEGRGGIEKDVEQARHWFMNAAKKGKADAAFLLGLTYLHKDPAKSDNAKAVHWVKYAARRDNLLAQRFMALAYEKGWMNIEVSESKSRYWWDRYEKLKLAKSSH